MSITTHGELKTAVKAWLNRNDLESQIPDFIRLAEQRIVYGGEGPYPSQALRVPAMQTRATGTISSNAIAFPSRFIEPIRLLATSGSVSWLLQYVPATQFNQTVSTDHPTDYTYLNNQIETQGTGAADYTLDYYQAFSNLTADADTNWLLTNAPGVYLYASLIESAPFIGDLGQLNIWLAMLKSQISAVSQSTRRQGGALQVRAAK